MEYQTKFDLTEEITNWKIALLENEVMDTEKVLELENHLLDTIDALNEQGLNDSEAFLIAQKRIGHVDLLTTEYQKVDSSLIPFATLNLLIKGALIALLIFSIVEMVAYVNLFFQFLLSDRMGIFIKPIIFNIALFLIVGLPIIRFFYLLLNNRLVLPKLILKIPVLITSILGVKFITFLLIPFLTRIVPTSLFGQLYMGLSIFKLILLLALLSFSFLFYRKKKKMDNFDMLVS